MATQYTEKERKEIEANLDGACFHPTKSFAGRYGFSITFGPHVMVGVGSALSDGNGNFEAKLQLKYTLPPSDGKPWIAGVNPKNQPPTANLTQWLKGTYSVNPDGTGHAKVQITMKGTVYDAKGVPKEVVLPPKDSPDPLLGAFDYVVLRAQEIDGYLVGVEMQGIDTTPAFNVDKLLRTGKVEFYEPPQIGVSWFERFPD